MLDGEWHTANEVRSVGGSEGLRRLRQLREVGVDVDVERANERGMFRYRIHPYNVTDEQRFSILGGTAGDSPVLPPKQHTLFGFDEDEPETPKPEAPPSACSHSEVVTPPYTLEEQQAYVLVDDQPTFDKLMSCLAAADLVAVDTETEGTALGWGIIGFSFSWRDESDVWDGAGSPRKEWQRGINSVYVPIAHATGDDNLEADYVIAKLDALFRSDGKSFVFHNFKFDYLKCRYEWRKRGLDFVIDGVVCDTILMAHVLCEERLGLKKLATAHIDSTAAEHEKRLSDYRAVWHRKNKIKKPPKTDPCSPSYYQYIPTDLMAQYAASDTAYTYALYELFYPRLMASSGFVDTYNVELNLAYKVLPQMEEAGVYVSSDALRRADSFLEGIRNEALQRMYAIVGYEFDPGKKAEIYPIVEALGLPVYKRTAVGGHPSLDKTTIATWNEEGYPFAEQYALWRQTGDLRGKYIRKMLAPGLLLPDGRSCSMLDEHGRLHCNFKSFGTVTGRLSSEKPNLQNIPRDRKGIGSPIRSAFEVPPEMREEGGFLLFVDYSQIEVRLSGHFSGDPLLIEAYTTGEDVHMLTAQSMFTSSWSGLDAKARKGMRQVAKSINFMILYGGSHKRLLQILKDNGVRKQDGSAYTLKECERFVNLHRQTYRVLNSWIADVRKQAKKDCYVDNAFGRRRVLPALKKRPRNEKEREAFSKAERQAVNTIVQGTAGDLFKRAMGRVTSGVQELGLRSRVVLNIHDEIILYAYRDEIPVLLPMIRERMEDFPQFNVPMKAEFSWSMTNWAEKKELDF